MGTPQQTYPEIPTTVDVMYLSKWLIGILTSVWISMPITLQALCVLMLMDYASGFAAARVTYTWSKRRGTDGLVIKSLTLMLIFACHYLSKIVQLGFDVGTTVAVAFCVNEFASIVENCNEAGVRVPPVVVDLLSRAKRIGSKRRRTAHHHKKGSDGKAA